MIRKSLASTTALMFRRGGTHVLCRSTMGSAGVLRQAPLRPHVYSLSTLTPTQGEKGSSVPNNSTAPMDDSTVTAPLHFKVTNTPHPLGIEKRVDTNMLAHEACMGPSVWTKEELSTVSITHVPAKDLSSKLAYGVVQVMRTAFDFISGYKMANPTADMYLSRIIFLETVAGVPGMVAAMLRHLKSLRSMQRDRGWIHTLLEEAENERMHLMTFTHIKQTGPLFRGAVILAQGVMANAMFMAYLVKPSFCHRLVGYLEEEAVKTYSHIIADLDSGKIPGLAELPVPDIAREYWRMGDNSTFRDLLMMVRADEANHRVVNHTLASLHEGAQNPFVLHKARALQSLQLEPSNNTDLLTR